MNIAGKFAVDGFHLRIAEFALVAGRHFAIEVISHKLHAVADAQHGNAQIKNAGVGLIIGFIHGIGAAGQDNAFGVEGFDVFQRHVVGVQLAINVGFAHAPGDELGNLRAEVENQDFVLGHDGFFAQKKESGKGVIVS